jgi:hypothetical protein
MLEYRALIYRGRLEQHHARMYVDHSEALERSMTLAKTPTVGRIVIIVRSAPANVGLFT